MEQQIRTSGFDAPAEAEWHRAIAEAAYYLASKRNFAPGEELADWLAAEAAAKEFLSLAGKVPRQDSSSDFAR